MEIKGRFIEGQWSSRSEFQMDYSNILSQIATNVTCPGCKATITCARWFGAGEGPAEWCETCKKGIGPTVG